MQDFRIEVNAHTHTHTHTQTLNISAWLGIREFLCYMHN